MTAPGIGTLVYLASYLIKVAVNAQQTAPDTPNQYGANLKIMGDQGGMNLDAIAGVPGPAGLQEFPFRQQDDANVNSEADLPTNLTNTRDDIGKYWLIDTLDPNDGHVTTQTAWTWYGTYWKQILIGTYGPPGAVPEIHVEEFLLDPSQTSYVKTGGGTMQPDWEFHLAQPAGPPGHISPLGTFPDVNEKPGPHVYDLLCFKGNYNAQGEMLWEPFSIAGLMPQPYSVPQSAFHAYAGVTQQANIGQFVLPPQNFDWTPIVWGHIGETGINLSSDPFLIGCEVLLGDPQNGTMVARGLGSTLGRVVIEPHYSTGGNKTQAITPSNNFAVVKAHHTPPTGTLYFNLWNDGQTGLFSFQPGGAQVFVMVVPIDPANQVH